MHSLPIADRLISYTFPSEEILRFPREKEVMLRTKSQDILTSQVKRTFDIIFSLVVILFIFSWLFPIIAIIIKCSSRGPILFVQDRIGLNGNVFKCFKFRTMRVSKVKYMYTPTEGRDSRVTAFGYFLRNTSLDELPQFFNVLLGDMTIVGPRPHPIPFHRTYATFVNNIDHRLFVKPGITGLAQIKGYRGDVRDFEENRYRTKKRIALDLIYIKTWSVSNDLWIVYTTIIQTLRIKA